MVYPGLVENSATPSPVVPEKTVYVTHNGTTMYSDPGTEHDVIRTFQCGENGVWLSDHGMWSRVCVGEYTGYIQKENLSETEVWPSMPEAFSTPRIVVYKDRRELLLFDGMQCYGRYAIGLGWTPVGGKQRQGDGKTPEGTYYVCCRNAHSRYYLSLGVSYPNIEDAASGLDNGKIDETEYKRIERAKECGGQPPWNTALGGEIMIHGGGSSSDWTAGCIAVDNDVMDVIWRMCPLGTTIEIYP